MSEDKGAIDELVSLGYTKGEAKHALAANDGNVDDAIDYLFTKGKAGKRASKPKNPPTFTSDDTTVADSYYTQTSTQQTGATPSFSLMAISAHTEGSQRGKPKEEQVTEEKPEKPPVKDGKVGADVGVPLYASTSRMKTASYPSDTDKKLSATAKGVDAKSKSIKDSSSTSPITGKKNNVDDDMKSIKSASTAHSRQVGNAMHDHPAVTPGAIAVEGANAMGHEDDITTGSYQPSLHHVEAELVDYDEENQIIEKRLQEELERERQRAHVAQVVSEEELKACQWKRVACVVAFVLVAFVVALSVSLTVGRSSTQEVAPPTPAPTPSPPPEEIVALIAPISFDGGASLTDPSSPQSFAARWLGEDSFLKNHTDARKIQRYALATLYYSTNGDGWTNTQKWLSHDENECDWWTKEFGADDPVLNCDDQNAITLLAIEENSMAGTLPDEIAFLSNSLVDLSFEKNKIKGTLSSTLGLMTNLRDLVLGTNNFTSTIPTELALLTGLEDLELQENMLTGTIFTELAQMTALGNLRLQKNYLTGTVPGTTIGALTALENLRLYENSFSGSVPTEIGLLTLLEELKVERSNFTGPIPTEIGLLTALEEFSCHENSMTGPLPTELGNLVSVTELRMVTNLFNGTIPSQFARMTSVDRLRLGENWLSGTIPRQLGFLPVLERLELQSNLLTGTIPDQLGRLTLMSDLRLSDNNLSGTIPTAFGQFVALKGLNLYNNSLVGSLPEFGELTSLKDLRAGFNMLTGTIPTTIARLTSMEELMLSNNMLTGTIPPLDNFTNLLIVHLYNNSFSGNATCPETITDCYLSCFNEGDETCRSL